MSAVPSKETPFINLAVASFVADDALPAKLVAVTVPVTTTPLDVISAISVVTS